MQFNPRIQPQLPSGRMAGVLATVLLIFALAPSARANPQASPEPEEARPPVIARHALPESDANQAEPSENFASLEEALVWLSHANEQDKSTDEIRKKLIARPLAHHSASSEIDDTPQLQSGDYDGDGARDLVVVLRDFCAADCPAQGPNWRGFIIWGDRTWSELLTGEAAEARAVALLPQGDLTGDGFPDIALSRETCGAHTCFKDARIFSVASTTQKPAPLRLIFDSAQQSDMATAKIALRTGKKPAEIILSSGDIGSAGAGTFQRNSSLTYTWNPQSEKFDPGKRVWETSDLRLHRFQDALNFWADKKPDKARKAFQEVIDSPALKDLPGARKQNATLAHQLRRELSAAARFELGMLAAVRNDSDEMARLLEKLEADTPKSPATAALREFTRAWKADGDRNLACRSAASKFPTKPDDAWGLDAIQLGYNAPVKFDASGLCVGH